MSTNEHSRNARRKAIATLAQRLNIPGHELAMHFKVLYEETGWDLARIRPGEQIRIEPMPYRNPVPRDVVAPRARAGTRDLDPGV